MSKPGDDYIVQPVMKALQVLDYVARQGHDVTLTETVQELNKAIYTPCEICAEDKSKPPSWSIKAD